MTGESSEYVRVEYPKPLWELVSEEEERSRDAPTLGGISLAGERLS